MLASLGAVIRATLAGLKEYALAFYTPHRCRVKHMRRHRQPVHDGGCMVSRSLITRVGILVLLMALLPSAHLFAR
ncbi:MAG: hypothetical protein ACUVWS_19310, partial [Roseiflexus sp.]